jgi:hypothetical protein
MFLILKRDWEAIDASAPREKSEALIPAGRHEVERIQNPYGHLDAPWLVLKGTKIGATESSWRQWKNGELVDNPGNPNHGKPIDWKEYEVIIEE